MVRIGGDTPPARQVQADCGSPTSATIGAKLAWQRAGNSVPMLSYENQGLPSEAPVDDFLAQMLWPDVRSAAFALVAANYGTR